MVNNFNVNKEISAGTLDRPYIYFDVVVALRKQVGKGNLLMDESSNIEDCIFFINSN